MITKMRFSSRTTSEKFVLKQMDDWMDVDPSIRGELSKAKW